MIAFSDISSLSDTAILRKMGDFIKNTRVERNITQEDLAQRAAVSRSTLSQIEKGENTSLLNLVKILRILDILYVLDRFSVSRVVSPMQIAREEKRRRRRASGNKGRNDKGDIGW